MRAFDRHEELDAALRRALQAERTPTPTQRAEAWETIRARAALQSVLPAEAVTLPWSARLRARLEAMATVLWSSRSVLTEEAAYRRARREEATRSAAYLRAPYVQFQPMW